MNSPSNNHIIVYFSWVCWRVYLWQALGWRPLYCWWLVTHTVKEWPFRFLWWLSASVDLQYQASLWENNMCDLIFSLANLLYTTITRKSSNIKSQGTLQIMAYFWQNTMFSFYHSKTLFLRCSLEGISRSSGLFNNSYTLSPESSLTGSTSRQSTQWGRGYRLLRSKMAALSIFILNLQHHVSDTEKCALLMQSVEIIQEECSGLKMSFSKVVCYF